MPKPIILDSSVVVKRCNSLKEDHLKQVDRVFLDGESGKITIYLPELSKYEVGNALLNKKLDLELAKASLDPLYIPPINFVALDQELADLTMEIALQEKITYYDACFLALAQKLGATLVTDNPKHQKRLHAKIKVVALEDYK
ncbi:MAG: type II toxin-antitoxin system VapC family toxin [Patescibacteria group bacterium]